MDFLGSFAESYSSNDSGYILVVGAEVGYLLNSIKDVLVKEHFTVKMSADITTIEKYFSGSGSATAILIYADETIVNDTKLLAYIKDKSTEEDVPVFIVGNIDSIADVKKIVGAGVISLEFVRPLNVKDMVIVIQEYLETHDKKLKKKILAVDDSAVMLNSIKTWLGEKYQVILADSGMAAIKSLTLNRPDLILLDYEMPIVDGRQVLEMIQSEIDSADIPVIFLTGKQDRASIMKVMALKPEGYLLKTMKPMEIVQYIDDFFEKRKGYK